MFSINHNWEIKAFLLALLLAFGDLWRLRFSLEGQEWWICNRGFFSSSIAGWGWQQILETVCTRFSFPASLSVASSFLHGSSAVKKTTEMKFYSEKSYYKSSRKNEPHSGSSARGGRCSHPLPTLLHQRGDFLLRFYEVSFGNVLGITDFLPGSRNRVTNHKRSCDGWCLQCKGGLYISDNIYLFGCSIFQGGKMCIG